MGGDIIYLILFGFFGFFGFTVETTRLTFNPGWDFDLTVAVFLLTGIIFPLNDKHQINN